MSPQRNACTSDIEATPRSRRQPGHLCLLGIWKQRQRSVIVTRHIRKDVVASPFGREMLSEVVHYVFCECAGLAEHQSIRGVL